MIKSILQSVKRLLGISEDDDSFDQNIVMMINSTLDILSQLGVEEVNSYVITGADETWDDLLKGRKDLEIVKTYIFMKVSMMFDPPASSAAMEAYKRQIDEHEWRICNSYKKGVSVNEQQPTS